MFNRLKLRHRPTLPAADFLYVRVADEIVARLALVSRSFPRALVAGPLPPTVREIFAAALSDPIFASPAAADAPDVVADIAMPFLRAVPLAISINDLALAPDPVVALGEMRGTLVPDGLFLGVAVASGTLGELSDALLAAEAELTGNAAMRVAPFADVRRWGDALARAGFALPVADEMRVTVRYAGVADLLGDLRAMGLTGILRERTRAPRGLFAATERHYRALHADPDGRLRATFVVAFLSGWAPDPSQQRPAKRGSATVRLEDALNAFRRPLSES